MTDTRAAGSEAAARLAEAVHPDAIANAPHILTESATRITEVAGSSGREWDVLLIQAGPSKNGRTYPAETLRSSARLFEGVPCYARHRQPGEGERHPSDKVGKFAAVRFDEAENGLSARFKVIAPWARDLLREMHEAGETDFIGFSIDAEGRVNAGVVEAITKAHSVDLVAEPAAGGRLQRLVASAEQQPAEEDVMDRDQVLSLVTEAVGDKLSAIEQAIAKLMPAAQPEQAAEPAPPPVDVKDVKETSVLSLDEDDRRLLVESRVDRALAAATGLSDQGRAFVREGLVRDGMKDRLTEADLTGRIRAQADYEAAIRPVLAQSDTARISVGDGQHDRWYKALIGWWGNKDEDGVRRFRTLQEGYCRWTGTDPWGEDYSHEEFVDAFRANFKGARSHKRITESLSRSSWGEVFSDSLYVMMLRNYRAESAYDTYTKFISHREDVPDFQTRHWVRVGGYGDMPSVAEGGTYTTLTSPGDEEVTFSLSKFGALDDVTFESLIDGRSNRMRVVPNRMINSMKRTRYKDFMDMLTTDNGTMPYDSVALYHSSHGNTGTTAFSVAGLDATQVAMRDQTAFGESLEILGTRNKIKFVIGPNELEARFRRVLNPSDGYTFALASTPDADTSMDPARWRGEGIEYHIYEQLTDANDWWAVADPSQVEVAIAGFLNGNDEPELVVQDDPQTGSVFTADKISWKCRAFWAFTMADHRGVYRQSVT